MKKIIIALILIPNIFFAQDDLTSEFITDDNLFSLLDKSNEEINSIITIYEEGNNEAALNQLAVYFKEKMSSSYFFDWKSIPDKFEKYSEKYPSKLYDHVRRKNEHFDLYPSVTKWERPLTGLNGVEITPYLIRHLARQHKMMDVGFCYYIENGNSEYIKYFTGQVQSLYDAYLSSDYEKEGNNVFEYYRAGYRVFNWLFVHNLFLSAEEYSTEDQLLLIKTFLYHGADLYNKTKKYNKGNHHTKGLVGLAQIAILFSEFEITGKWLNHAVAQLTRHLQNEINDDGFQFERSIHYHVGDIDNYFYVYYLAQINDIELPDEFVNKFRSMFDAIVKLAMPNKKLPVLQDDTDSPWAEYNSIESPMFTGTLLFQDPAYKYFSGNKIPSKKFWFVRDEDASKIKSVAEKKPAFGSISLDETGYYVMRSGWNKNDPYMVISAGLSDKKPDHQHGDMLGLYAYYNSQIILPNYQVRYFLEDYKYFKNSFVKNVAIVDSMPHGQKWKGNTGGSGFGKFKSLPLPEVLLWQTHENYDLFIGTHDGYLKNGIEYYRKVLFVKDGFWIVKDEFVSDSPHDYQQIWQGHYNMEADERHLRTTFQNGSGLDIYQLNDHDYTFASGSFRGKGNAIISTSDEVTISFITLLNPFSHFEERLLPADEKFKNLKGWNYYKSGNVKFEAGQVLSKGNRFIIFDMQKMTMDGNTITVDNKIDIILQRNDNAFEFISFNGTEQELLLSDSVFAVGDTGGEISTSYLIKPGEKIRLFTK